MFIVQTAIHGDSGSHHATVGGALGAIEDLIREGLAEPGEFNVRELDDDGRIVRAHELEPDAGGASSPAAR